MKGGAVISIRLSPQDVMAIIDVIDVAKIYIPGMSLAQAAKTAIEGLLEAARQQGVIEQRDGFEYEQMVSRFKGVSQVRKRNVTEVMEAAGVARAIMDRPRALAKLPQPREDAHLPANFDELIIKKGCILLKINELAFKQKADPDNFEFEEQAELAGRRRELAEIEAQLG